MREHRQPRLSLHAGNQALAPAGNDDVDIAVEAAEHQPDRGAVAGGDKLDGGCRQAGVRHALHQRGMDGAARAQAVGAAAQDRGIAGFQAERAGVGGHVRPAFVNDSNDSERDADALDGHAVGPRPGRHDAAHRIT